MSCLDTSLLCLHKVVPRLHSEARLRRCHHALLTVVHTPEAVKLSKVHIGLDTAVLPGWKRVSRSGTEEAPVGAGAAALRVCVGGLQGQSGALAAEEGRKSVWGSCIRDRNFQPSDTTGPLVTCLSDKDPRKASWVRCSQR